MRTIFDGLFRRTDERNYQVEPAIVFVFSHDSAIDEAQLREAILDADKAAPWKDEGWNGRSINALICTLKEHQMPIHCHAWPEKACWFQVAPMIQYIRRSQFYAYEHYLSSLAEVLASKKFAGVLRVNAVLKTTHIDTFA